MQTITRMEDVMKKVSFLLEIALFLVVSFNSVSAQEGQLSDEQQQEQLVLSRVRGLFNERWPEPQEQALRTTLYSGGATVDDVVDNILALQKNAANDNGWIVIDELLDAVPNGSFIDREISDRMFLHLYDIIIGDSSSPTSNEANALRVIKKLIGILENRMHFFDTKKFELFILLRSYIRFIAQSGAFSKGRPSGVQPEEYIAVLQDLLGLQPSATALWKIQQIVKKYAAQDPYNKYWQEIEALIGNVVSQKQEYAMRALNASVVRPVEKIKDSLTGKIVNADSFSPEMQAEVLRLLTGIEQKKPLSASDEQAQKDLELYHDENDTRTFDVRRKQELEQRQKGAFNKILKTPLPDDGSDLDE